MRKKLFTFLLAIVACIETTFAEKVQIGDLRYNLDTSNLTAMVLGASQDQIVRVDDNSITEWDSLPKDYVASATCPENAMLKCLKSVKVYADYQYINFLLDVDDGYESELSEEELSTLRFISKKLIKGIRPHELVILSCLKYNKYFKQAANAVPVRMAILKTLIKNNPK